MSATMLGAALGVDEIQTWKDVDGILTTDPRIAKNARPVPEVTYEEAQELAMFGSQVLHPRSMIPCRKTGTPVRVKNSYNIKSEGSVIRAKHSGKTPRVLAITNVKNVDLIDIQSNSMFGACGFLVEDLKKAADVTVKNEKAIVTIICDASSSSSILADAFAALKKENINVQMISQGASKVNISFLVDNSQANTVVQILHKALFE